MKQMKFVKFIVLVAMLATATRGFAWETTEFWTPCIIDIHSYAVPELMIGNYFTINKKIENGGGAFPTDIGIEIGVLPFNKVHMEVGIDAMEPSDDPYMFNTKIGTPEDVLFKGAPGLAVGIFDVGTNPATTAYDIGDIIVGKTIPYIGRLHIGYYYGNHAVLVNGNGQPDNQGWMIGYDRTIITISTWWMDSIVLAADYASGNNYIGGGGFGLYLNWTKNISLLTGPVWFNDYKINGPWKWTTQIYVNF
jgi:hypothetical protein